MGESKSAQARELAVVARRVTFVTQREINKHRTHSFLEVFAPDIKDFEIEFEPYVQRMILQAKLEVLERHGTFPEAQKIMNELNELNFQIAKRERPDR